MTVQHLQYVLEECLLNLRQMYRSAFLHMDCVLFHAFSSEG
jgi:hypothetical protein